MGTVELFNRKAELTIAPVSGATGIVLKELRFTFNVEKTKTSEPNKATIQIYNLAPNTRDWLQKKEQGIELKAGYSDSIERLYTGDIDRLEHKREGVDIITQIECKDGGTDLVKAEFQRSYRPGTSKSHIVQDVVNAMPNTGSGNSASSVVTGTIKSKLVLSGSCRRILDKLSRSFSFEWSIQNGNIQLLTPGTGTTSGPALAIVLSSSSGMIGAPTKTDRGATAKSLMIPQANPGAYVLLEGEFVSGAFRVDKSQHQGDTWGGDWTTDMELKRL